MSKYSSEFRFSQLSAFTLAAAAALQPSNATAFGFGDVVDPLHVLPIHHDNPPPVSPPPPVVPGPLGPLPQAVHSLQQAVTGKPATAPFVPAVIAPPEFSLLPPSLIPEQFRPIQKEIQNGGQNLQKNVEHIGKNVVTTFTTAGNNTVRILKTAGGNTINTVRKAGGDTLNTVTKAGSNVVATYVKGWSYIGGQARNTFNEAIEAGKAVEHFTQRQVQANLAAMNDTVRHVREGRIVDAVWDQIKKEKAGEKNFAQANKESAILRAATRYAATVYGGPAGAAAYAAWWTYEQTGDANLALREGALAALSSEAGHIVTEFPANTPSEVVTKAGVGGAVGGVATAAAGGNRQAITNAFLKSGSQVLVQGASDQLKAYSPDAADAAQAVQCVSAKDVKCLASTSYAKSAKQHIGQWTGIDPDSVEGKEKAIVTEISKVPETQAIPIANNQWVVTWTLGQNKTLTAGRPAVILTRMGPNPPFKSTVDYNVLAASLPKPESEAGLVR